MINYNQQLASMADMGAVIYYKNQADTMCKILNIYVFSINDQAETVYVRIGETGDFKTRAKRHIWKLINFHGFSYEAS